jgi:ornithine decarboxylase
LKELHKILFENSSLKHSFYAFYPGRVWDQIQLWNKYLPFVKAHYAIKSNPEPLLIKALYPSDVYFDCASKQEIALVKTNLPSDIQLNKHIVYANPCKSSEDLIYAKSVGSPITVVDSYEELDKLVSVDYTGGTYIRIAVDDTHSKMPFSGKFGLQPSQVKELGKYAKNKNIDVRGISFHVGSSCSDGKSYYKALRIAQQLNRVLKTQGHLSNTIDIGGGFLSNPSDFIAKANYITTAYDKEFNYIAEPGRFFSHKSQDFFVKVIGKKPWSSGWRYTIDDSLYGQFSCIPFDHVVPTWCRVVGPLDKVRNKTAGVLFGRTCDSVDVIAKSDSMEELEIGDWLWFPHMGSYTNATANEFNGFPKPPVITSYNSSSTDYELSCIDYLPDNVETIQPLSSASLLR